MTFKVGDRVRAARDITEGMAFQRRDPGNVWVRKDDTGLVFTDGGRIPRNFDFLVKWDRGGKMAVLSDWLEPADAPADAGVVATIVAALTAERDGMEGNFVDTYVHGFDAALRIVREIGKVQP